MRNKMAMVFGLLILPIPIALLPFYTSIYTLALIWLERVWAKVRDW